MMRRLVSIIWKNQFTLFVPCYYEWIVPHTILCVILAQGYASTSLYLFPFVPSLYYPHFYVKYCFEDKNYQTANVKMSEEWLWVWCCSLPLHIDGREVNGGGSILASALYLLLSWVLHWMFLEISTEPISLGKSSTSLLFIVYYLC